jgi:AmmeMemoRadiSam system protein A
VTALPARPSALSDSQRADLLAIALGTIRQTLDGEVVRPPDPSRFDPPLRAAAATFVTLERDGRLLGCIGSLEADRPLVTSVARHARAAAFADPRLPPVTADDYEAMEVSVSHVGPLQPVDAPDHDALVAVVRPGLDGLVLEVGRRRATLLPSVWRQVTDVDELLDLLWTKAGVPRRWWPARTRVLRYVTNVFAEPGPRASVSNARPPRA